MKVIEVHNLSISFAQKKALENINLEVTKGHITTLLGPNGCGKSTLLKAIMGSIPFKHGSIIIDGQEQSKYSASQLAQKVAFLPQVQSVPKDMVVEELIACGRFPYQKWWKSTDGEDRKIISEVMAATKTTRLSNQLVSSLSGGERQRVWIAMALAQEPEILILDEPTTYLDINHQFETLELIKRLNKEQGLTVLMVLHELNQAAIYSHDVAILKEGKLIAKGTPSEVMTGERLKQVFSVQVEVEQDSESPLYVKVKGLLP